MDLTGIHNYNEYYTNHYFSSVFEENAKDTLSNWRSQAQAVEDGRTPWSLLRECSKLYYSTHDKYLRSRSDAQILPMIQDMADLYLAALGFPPATNPLSIEINDSSIIPVYLEMKKPTGAPMSLS